KIERQARLSGSDLLLQQSLSITGKLRFRLEYGEPRAGAHSKGGLIESQLFFVSLDCLCKDLQQHPIKNKVYVLRVNVQEDIADGCLVGILPTLLTIILCEDRIQDATALKNRVEDAGLEGLGLRMSVLVEDIGSAKRIGHRK